MSILLNDLNPEKFFGGEVEEILISVRKQGPGLVAAVRRGDVVSAASHPLPEFEQSDGEALRWLMEDSPRLGPETVKSARIQAEARLKYFGAQLFDALRQPLQSALGDRSLDRVALSVVDPEGLTRHWPWELLSQDELQIALACQSFTRRVGRAPSRLSTSQRAGPLRLLFVVARPRGPQDVAFRSVASRVLAATSQESIQVELLRPPTFTALRERLLAALDTATPYDIVHFDGHGTLLDTLQGRKGVLLFEAESATESGVVDGSRMGELLGTADVPLLILNACYAGAAPLNAPSSSTGAPASTVASASFAEEVASSGAIDVVAMSHAVYVSTAALIVWDLYRCLDRGHSVGAAASFARRRWRESFVDRSPSIGFCIVRHFGCPGDSSSSAGWPDYEQPSRSDNRTPHHPRMQPAFCSDAPLVGADDPILLLERAMRRTSIVQLNGLRGSGKTSLLLELGRWLAASKAADPERIIYLDLGAAPDPAQAVESVACTGAAILLIDHADCILGDPLRDVSPWPSDHVDALMRALEAKSKAAVQIVVAASARIEILGHGERVVVPRLEPADIRALVELRTDRATGAQLAEPVLLWTAGNPGVVPIIIDRQATGAFADAAQTLVALSELGFARFWKNPPPLQQILPLQLPGGAALFEADVGMPWLLMQFQGQALMSKILWDIANGSGLSSLADGVSQGLLARILDKLEKSGLVVCLDAENILVHPLLPCLIAQPFIDRRLHTEGYVRSLARVQSLYGHYIQWLAASPLSGDWRSPGNAKGWDFANLLHAFACVAGELQVEHMAALSLARQLRAHLLAMELPEYWVAVLQKLKEVFKQVLPAPDDGLFNPHTEMNLLLMEEARRQGNDALAAELAQKTREGAQNIPGPAQGEWEMPNREGGWPQANAYDVQIKTGRQLADSDMNAALAAFNAALALAGNDELTKANVQLELTRLQRRLGTASDLSAARVHGESALSIFLRLLTAGLINNEMVVLITMSLSLVYQDLVQKTPKPDSAWAGRGEALCRESLRLAEKPTHKATAWYNLGGWRRSAGDFPNAAQAFLEAANLYEALDDALLYGYSLAYRSQCLFEAGDFIQARLDGERAVTLLVKQPKASKALILQTYEAAEQAKAKITTKAPE